MSDSELKEQMERETLESWRSPALNNLNSKKDPTYAIMCISGLLIGIIIGVLLK